MSKQKKSVQTSDVLLAEVVGKAIAETLDEWEFDQYMHNWIDLKPNGPQLGLGDDLPWRDFLGRILYKVNDRIKPCRTALPSDFYAFKSKTLDKLRYAAIDSIKCPPFSADAKVAK